ncbi:MAG: nicotinate-nucleotide--dimethylbenzimidazole phosphoribosyltransferase [Lachnospiraceae bacterium]
MECLKKPNGIEEAMEWIKNLKAEAIDEAARQQVLKNWDQVAKPIGGLGEFEYLIARLGGIVGSPFIQITKKAVVIMCADNGIIEEGVSQSGKEVTLAVARAMGMQKSVVGQMAKEIGADTYPIDIGIDYFGQIPGVVDKKVRKGTGNFSREAAMTLEEALQAIRIGVDLVKEYKQKGYQILATGELGMGNTTTSSAVAAALLQCTPDQVCGRGAGLSNEGLSRKKKVIQRAIEDYGLYQASPLEVLRCVGGLDIAGLCGICIGGALYHVPIVLDGVISMTSALLAERLVPGVGNYLLPSHQGREPAIKRLAEELNLKPVIGGSMALGEGTGAVMMLSLLDIALRVYQEGETFGHMQLEPYIRYET